MRVESSSHGRNLSMVPTRGNLRHQVRDQFVPLQAVSPTTAAVDGWRRGREESIVNTTSAGRRHTRARKANYSATPSQSVRQLPSPPRLRRLLLLLLLLLPLRSSGSVNRMSVDGCQTATRFVYRWSRPRRVPRVYTSFTLRPTRRRRRRTEVTSVNSCILA